METLKKRLVMLPLLLVLTLASLALGAAFEEAYKPVERSDAAVVVAHRVAFSSDDSATSLTPIDPQDVGGDPTIVVAPRFTASGATATVEVWLFQRTGTSTYTLMGISNRQTATASTTLRAGAAGNYLLHAPLFFDSCGADVYDVRYRSVSSGNVEPFAWTCGARGAFAE